MVLEQKDIRQILSHRYSFILVDRVKYMDEDRIVAVKNITSSDINLWGHFEDDPIYPGVLLIESCSQAGGILLSNQKSSRGYIAQINEFKFLSFVRPGDSVHIEATINKVVGQYAKVSVAALVEDKIIAKGEVMYFFDK